MQSTPWVPCDQSAHYAEQMQYFDPQPLGLMSSVNFDWVAKGSEVLG